MPQPQKPRNDSNKQQHRINEQIRVREVRIVGDDIEPMVVPTRQALDMARQQGVDLVEISPNDEHDYNFKLKHAKEFLSDGDKVKAYVFFRGRSILFKEQGEVLLLRFANDLEEYGKVESMPKLEGKRMIIFIAPKKTGGSNKKAEAQQEELPVERAPKTAPKVKEKKEYQGPRVEGEDF